MCEKQDLGPLLRVYGFNPSQHQLKLIEPLVVDETGAHDQMMKGGSGAEAPAWTLAVCGRGSKRERPLLVREV